MRRQYKARATKLLIAVLAAILLPVSAQAQDSVTIAETPAYTSDVFVEYGIPGHPRNVAVEAPGRIWVTLPALNAVGVISRTTPSQAQEVAYVARYWILRDSMPVDLSYDAGSVWFTQRQANKIGRMNTTDYLLEEYAVPTMNSEPNGIDVAPNGDVWFTELAGNQLGRLVPATGAIQEFAYPIANGDLADVAVSMDDTIWFTAPNVNRVVNYNPTLGRFFSVPTLPFLRPIGLAVEPGGVPWVAANGSSLVGRYAPGTLAFWRWTATPTPDSGPFDLVLEQKAGGTTLFLSEAKARKVARFDIAADSAVTRIRELGVAARGCQPQGIDVDSAGAAWIACGDANTVIEWREPFVRDNYLPLITKETTP